MPLFCQLILQYNVFSLKNILKRYFPGSAMDKNWPANAGDTGSIFGQEDSSCPGATKPMSHNY